MAEDLGERSPPESYQPGMGLSEAHASSTSALPNMPHGQTDWDTRMKEIHSSYWSKMNYYVQHVGMLPASVDSDMIVTFT
jgi:hypothetical protein